MKRTSLAIILAVIAALMPSFEVTGQDIFTQQIGFSTLSGTSFGPIYRSSNTSNFDFSRHSHLYLNDELNMELGSTILKVEWFKTNTAKTTQPGIFSIWMENTTDTIKIPGTSWNFQILPFATNVYSDSMQTVGDSTGWTAFEVDPFTYTGENLEIHMAWDISAPTVDPSDGGFFWRYSPAIGLGIGKAGQSTAAVNVLDVLNHGDNRPNIRITYQEPIKDDAAITDIISPNEPIALGNQNFDVEVANFGNVPLTGANVYGTITNTTTMATTSFGPVAMTDSLAIGASTIVTLGTFNLVSGSYEITAWTTDPNGNPVDYNMSNDTLTEFLDVEDDAGVSAILSPGLPLVAGVQNYDVVVTNFGNVALNNVDVYGTLTDVINMVTISYGPVSTSATIPVGGSDTVTLGSINLPGGTFEFVAWTANPNGNPNDFDNSNDTTVFNACTQLPGGTYTINAGLPLSNTNFPSFQAAIDAMQDCGGISGPVFFNVAPGSGPYVEQIVIPEIIGASATNRITFNGNGETITFTPPCSFCSSQYLIRMNGADHVTLTNLVIEAGAGSPAIFNIHMLNGNDSCTITNCTILNDTNSTSPNYGNIVLSGSATSQFTPEPDGTPGLTVTNNTIIGGYTGVFFNGPSASNPSNTSPGLTIANNTIRSNVYGIRVVGADAPLVSQNDIDLQGKSTIAQGIYMDNVVGAFRVERNKVINMGDAGIFMTQINDNSTALGLVVNNMLGGGYTTNFASYGIFMSDVDRVGIIHNSILVDGGSTTNSRGIFDANTNTSSGLLIVNNSFANTAGGVAMELNNPGGLVLLDNNNYYATGPNLVEYGPNNFYSSLDTFKMDTAGPFNHDSKSREGDPQYVSSTDLHLAGTQLLDGGTASVGILDDFDGEARDLVNPDIGADEETPPPPACSVPGNVNTINIGLTSATLDWDVVPNSVGYIIEGRPVGVPVTITLALPSGATSFFNVANLQPATSYEWQIKAVCSVDGLDTSEFSALTTFTTLSCTAPDSAFTTNVTATSARLNWIPVPGAVGYEITGQAIGGPLVTLTVAGGASSFFQVNNLPTGVTFQWSVKSICSTNGTVKSPFTNFSMFTTMAPSAKDGSKSNLRTSGLLVDIYPNPNDGLFRIDLFNTHVSSEITILDLSGRVITRSTVPASNTGAYEIIELDEVEPGVYIVQIVSGTERAIERIVIQ